MQKLLLASVFSILGIFFFSSCGANGDGVTFKVEEVRSSDGYILVHVKDLQEGGEVGTYKYPAKEGTTTIVVKDLTVDGVYHFRFTHDESKDPDMDFWKDPTTASSDAVDYESMNPNTSPIYQITEKMDKTVHMRYFQ